jgi:neutral ceramidase
MAGYGVPNRFSQGIHDRLYVRALFFEDPKNGPLAILQLDLLCLDRICLEKICQELNSDFPNLNKSHLLICTTHTHSGFGGIFDTENGINRELISLFGKNDPELVNFLARKCIEAILEASGNCVETTVMMNRGTIDGLGTNRRKKDIPCDNSLFVMEFFRQDQKKILLYNLCCHPTVLSGENLLLSADFPGAVAGKLEEAPGAYDMVVFINGSAGDMSTRFTRKESSFDECDRYSDIIVNALSDLKKGDFFPLEKVELQYHSISLKRAEIPDARKAKENLQTALQNLEDLKNKNADTAALRKAASLVEGAQMSLIRSGSAAINESVRTVETGILRINDTIIICSPFELFSSLALILKGQKPVDCFGYANSLEGYLADCDAWDNLDYEALFSDFKRGEGERYIELVSALV